MIELLSGLLLLIAGAELMVRAAVRLAARLHVRPLIIGLTIVALGSSAPQMAVSLQATLAQNADIAVGNVIGSNLFNLLGVLGLTALIAPSPLSVSPNALDFDLPVMLGVAVLCLPVFYSGYRVTRAEGLLFLGCLLYTSDAADE